MPAIGYPDLLSNTVLSRAASQTSRDLARVTEEVTSGLKSDLVEATGGDPFRLYQIERDLRLAESYRTNIDLAEGRTTVTQNALSQIEDTASPFGVELLSLVTEGDIIGSEVIASNARDAFSSIIATLNSRFGDRSLFAGAATDRAAVEDPDVILAEIESRVATAPDAATVVNIVNDYFFADPAGYASTGYIGSTADAASAEVADGESISFALRGDDAVFRQALESIALVVIAGEESFAGTNRDEKQALLEAASGQVISSSSDIVIARGELGVAEARIEELRVQAEAQRQTLEEARNRIVIRDQFEAVTEFTALETQLQTVFSITARLSGLNLTNFLR